MVYVLRADRNYNSNRGRYDDIEIEYECNEDNETKWLARLCCFARIEQSRNGRVHETLDIAVIKSFWLEEENLGWNDDVKCYSYHFNRASYDVVSVNSIIRRIHMVPDMDKEDTFYHNERVHCTLR